MHGFARNVDWTLVSTTDGDEPSMTMELTPNDYTKAMWDKDFKVTETVTLKGGALEARSSWLRTRARKRSISLVRSTRT